MPRTQLISLLFIFTPFISGAVPTVSFVELERYLGKWYEIASIPASFQKKCVKNTTAEYSALDFGKIDVVNSCEKKDGKREVAHGIAQVANQNTQAELKVSFVPFFNHLGWFAGQYKILALDPEYQFSLVGEDQLKFGWILSRTPSLPRSVLVELENEITRLGYDSCDFLMTVQDEGSVVQRQPLCLEVKQ